MHSFLHIWIISSHVQLCISLVCGTHWLDITLNSQEIYPIYMYSMYSPLNLLSLDLNLKLFLDVLLSAILTYLDELLIQKLYKQLSC